MKWLGELVDRVFVVVGALVFCQGPLFIQQYTQRLAGHVDELQLQIDAMHKVAKKSGKSFAQYVQKFLSSTDVDFASQGELMQGMQTRFTQLSDSLVSLQQANLFTKPFVFLKHLNFDIFSSTMWSFQPGLLLTAEGLLYALVGMLFGYSAFRFLKLLFGRRKPQANLTSST